MQIPDSRIYESARRKEKRPIVLPYPVTNCYRINGDRGVEPGIKLDFDEITKRPALFLGDQYCITVGTKGGCFVFNDGFVLSARLFEQPHEGKPPFRRLVEAHLDHKEGVLLQVNLGVENPDAARTQFWSGADPAMGTEVIGKGDELLVRFPSSGGAVDLFYANGTVKLVTAGADGIPLLEDKLPRSEQFKLRLKHAKLDLEEVRRMPAETRPGYKRLPFGEIVCLVAVGSDDAAELLYENVDLMAKAIRERLLKDLQERGLEAEAVKFKEACGKIVQLSSHAKGPKNAPPLSYESAAVNPRRSRDGYTDGATGEFKLHPKKKERRK